MLRRHGAVGALLLALVVASSGCGNAEHEASLYRAERIFFQAKRAETRARLGGGAPDSITLLRVRERFLEVRKEVPGPYVAGEGGSKRPIDIAILRLVGAAESQGAKLAMEARAPVLALEAAERLKTDAAGDSALGRQASFMKLAALHALQRYDDAVAEMKEILDRYPPQPPPPNGEDPILALPETIVRLRRQLGQEEEARSELKAAVVYFRSLLERSLPVGLEAQVRARIVRTALELDQPGRALSEADSLGQLVQRHPELRSMLAEVAFARGKIRAASERDPSEGVAILQRVATDFPDSPFAPRALFEAAGQLETKGRYREAKEAYEVLLQRYPAAPEVAPLALYRLAVVQERMDNWIGAKQTFEAIPVRYPQSQSAAEAPLAVIQHYVRAGMRTAARNYFPTAHETYQTLIERDSTGRFAPAFRVKQIYLYLSARDSLGLYAAVESMARNHPYHPFTAQVLLEAARAANAFGAPQRGVGYLREFLRLFPKSPMVEEVNREIRSHGG